MSRLALVVTSLVATLAFAGELKGVKSPDSITVEGKNLVLNGMGLRTKVVFKVYVASLYLEAKEKDPAKIIAADGVRQVKLHMLRDLESHKVTEALTAGFEKNSKADLPKLKDRLDTLVKAIPDLKEGQELSITYVPGKGTTVSGPGKEATVEGKDFNDALLKVWLGADPVDGDCKSGMLGNN